MECFKIEWKGFFSSDKVQDQPEAREKGIYVFYEMSWEEPERVLYIGQAQALNKRLKQHLQNWSHILSKEKMKELRVCVGIVYPLAESDASIRGLLEIESFFINTFKPEGNDASTKKGYKGSPIIIVNTGKIGLFKKVISSHPELLTLLKENLSSSLW